MLSRPELVIISSLDDSFTNDTTDCDPLDRLATNGHLLNQMLTRTRIKDIPQLCID